ncbi:MAG: acyl carrier protein [Acidimicrobiales bacterium]
MDDEIRQIVATYGRISVDVYTLPATDDLFEAGMTSHANVNVMLALENAFDIEFPEVMLRRSTFASITAISEAVSQLKAAVAAS